MELSNGQRCHRMRVRKCIFLGTVSAACSLGTSSCYVSPAARPLSPLHRGKAQGNPGLTRRHLVSAVAIASVFSPPRRVVASSAKSIAATLSREDRVLSQAEQTLKEGKKLEEEGLLLEAQESKVLGQPDIASEELLERKEEKLTQKIRVAEKKILKEEEELELGRSELQTAEELIKKKVLEVEKEKLTLQQEFDRLKKEEEEILASEERLNQDMRTRRDRAPRVFNIIPALQEIFRLGEE